MSKEFHIGRWPGRKLPILTMTEKGGNSHEVIATFKSEAAAAKFIEALRVGVYLDER